MLAVLGYLCGLGAWVCSILVGVQAYKRKETVMAILCFLPCLLIVGLIYGWVKAEQWGIKNLMIGFTILFVLAVVFGSIGSPLLGYRG